SAHRLRKAQVRLDHVDLTVRRGSECLTAGTSTRRVAKVGAECRRGPGVTRKWTTLERSRSQSVRREATEQPEQGRTPCEQPDAAAHLSRRFAVTRQAVIEAEPRRPLDF